MRLLRKACAFFRDISANGDPNIKDPEEALRISYRHLLRLADQIQAHAEQAPYPQVAARLREIALQKRDCANLLREKIGVPSEESMKSRLEIKSGKNHWERMVRDWEDQKALETKLLDEALLLASDAPEAGDLLRKVASAQAPHKQMLLDLVARADPQADLS